MPEWLRQGKDKADDIKAEKPGDTEKPTGEGSNALLVAQQGEAVGDREARGRAIDVAAVKAGFATGPTRATEVLRLAEQTSRARMIELVAQLEDADLRALAESQVGLALIDAVVHTKKTVAFTKLAIHAVWDVEFDESDWAKRDLHHLYFMFREVPRSHIRGLVRQLREGASKTDGSSWYKGVETPAHAAKRGDIEMAQMLPSNLSMGGAENLLRHRTARAAALLGMGGVPILALPAVWGNQKFLKARSPYSQAMRPKNAYQMTALHEIGHAVDARLGVMSKYQRRPDFGGWEEYKDEASLAEGALAASTYTTFAASADYTGKKAALDHDEAHVNQLEADYEALPAGTPKAERRARMEAKNEAKKDANVGSRSETLKTQLAHEQASFNVDEQQHGVTRADMRALVMHLMQGGAVKEFATTRHLRTNLLEAHPVTKAILAGRGNNKWMRDESTLTKSALGGRSFAQAYGSTYWISFDISAKREGVSHYQWRAPGEWFAELYAHFYMGTLAGHPLYAWFKSEIHEKDPQNRPPDQQDVATPEQVAEQQAGEGAEAEGEQAQAAAPQPQQLPQPDQASRGSADSAS